MRRIWCWWLASSLAAAASVQALTVIEKDVVIHLESAERMSRTTRLHLRLDTPADLESQGQHAISLGENETLIRADARAVYPDGRRGKVGRKQRDTVEATVGAGTFHQSLRFEVLEFDRLEVGSEIHLEVEVETAPYFPAGLLTLRDREPIASLRVELRSDVPSWRHRLVGPADDLQIVEREDGLLITGQDVAAVEELDWGPRDLSRYSTLHYTWGEAEGWAAVGGWYQGLLDALPGGSGAVRQKARELIAGVSEPRQRLEILLAFLRRQVRYVAVEVGIGGYRPSPPEEVLERRWGDCKDKSLLLIEMLREAGITAHPALIRAGDRGRIEPAFASPTQFNHLIVAVPEDAVAVDAEDPVASGYLWLDPTQTRGGAGWLNTAVRDQHALVVEPGGPRLVETPSHHGRETLVSTVTLAVDRQGRATGAAELHLQGALGLGLLEQSESEPPERVRESVHALFSRVLPGAELTQTAWRAGDEDLPWLEIRVGVERDGFVEAVASASPSLRLPGWTLLPPPGDLRDREAPVVLRPGVRTMRWHLQVPEDWCVPEASEIRVENELGAFAQTLTPRSDPKGLTVERRVSVGERWIEPGDVEALRELAVAERRAQKRRIRLRCEGAAGP